jgi:hypothetical protein
LDVYKKYPDPAGVQNAQTADKRLLVSMEKLAQTVVKVKDLVGEMKDHGRKADRRAVGKRSLTKMTDQMARTE